MSLAPGARIGPYEVTAPLAAGGMGEVYRARDHRLRRDVAIKIISSPFTLDPVRVARFAREAQVLAALNHPNIATLFGLEEADGTQALILELVDGETLGDRLAAQPAGLSIESAVTIAQQVAAGLEAAHEDGIVHRDLKPANIAIRPDGTVKLLDFGLARALESTSGDLAGPTMTISETAVGTILGTPAYMSPEQARGLSLDKRTDIWSFGCVLYEMLTGRPAFRGQTSSDTIAAILNLDPDWEHLPATTPAPVRMLLRRCLEKDPRRRLRDIGDARIELEMLIASRSSPSPVHHPEGQHRADRPSAWRRRVALSGAAIALVALTVAGTTWLRFQEPAAVAEAVHMTALLPPGVTVTRGPGMLLSLALSPDGRRLVVAATDDGGQRLYVRPIDRIEAMPLGGTEGALCPFFSPDGEWIGFFADRRLKRVPVGGGAAVDITDAPGYPAGATWGPDDRIVFAAGYLSPLRIVTANGGASATLTTPSAGQGHQFPEILPDGRTLLFNEGSSIQALDLVSGRRTALVRGTVPRYVSSGHLIFRRQTSLMAVPFDPERFELTGPVTPVVEGVAIERGSGGAPHVAISRTGTLAYVRAAERYALVVVRGGETERVLSEDPLLENPQFSPDGKRVAVARTPRAGDTPELWVYDIDSAVPPSRLTSDGGRAPVWTPDGSAITYSRPVPNEASGIYTRPSDGSGTAQRIVALSNFHWLVGWTPRRTLAYGMMEGAAADGVSRSSILVTDGRESQYVVGPGDTWGGRLSPDGRWLAYYSLESGYFEVYVTSFPAAGTRSLVAEGTDPAWSPDGSEIYYRSGGRLMAARIETSSGVRVLSRRLVVEPFAPPLYDDYTIHPDGRTLSLVRPTGDAQGREVTVVLNWVTELRRLVHP